MKIWKEKWANKEQKSNFVEMPGMIDDQQKPKQPEIKTRNIE